MTENEMVMGEQPKQVRDVNPRWATQLAAMAATPRCGAHCKSTGQPCKAAGIRRLDGTYGRCRNHGGASTGARTTEGIERIRRAVTKHGKYSQDAKERRSKRHAGRLALRSKLKTLEEHAQAVEDVSRWLD